MVRFSLTLVPSVIFFINAASGASSPPAGAITVGNGGKYSTLQDALADSSSQVYFVLSGTYTGQTIISRSNIQIYGQTSNPQSYDKNTVTFTNSLVASSAGGDDQSGTIRVLGSGVSLYNLNISNTFGDSAYYSQAIALSVENTHFGGYGLKLKSYQDTLLANVGYEFYSNCWIEGAVDFIFGLSASVWITKSVINAVGDGHITASGRSSNDSNWFVIDSSNIKGSGYTYLGRPWRDHARVVFQNSYLHSRVYALNPAGWNAWSPSSPNTDHVTFSEYGNTGAGARGQRASFATNLSSPVSINTVLGSTSWIDSTYL